LIGADTAGRKWIDYEIEKSWQEGKGILGINIHNITDFQGNQVAKGSNPFNGFNIGSKPLSSIVKTYDPPYFDSKIVYGYIANNLESWIVIDQDILEFISYFSSIVFQKGGIVIHGSHPLFTPVIVEQARKFAKGNTQLKLYVSAMWGSEEIKKYSPYAEIIEIPSYKNSNNPDDYLASNQSLKLLRNKMGGESNSILSIGGRLYPGSQIIP
jgi:hypothetical protein